MARAKPVAEFIDRCLGPTLAAQGFAASDIITAWPEIVGAMLPLPRRRKSSGHVRQRDEPRAGTLFFRAPTPSRNLSPASLP